MLSYIVLSSPASSCVKAEETQSVAGARCYCVWILSVTVHSGRTKTVLRRQAWSREQHRILLQTGQCLCQVLPSYTQQTLCSVSPHSQLCPVWIFFSPSYSLYLLYSFFCLEQVGLHWSRHLGCRWEAQIAEGLRTDLGIRDRSLNLQDTKRWRVEWTWKKLSRVALQTAWQRATRKGQGTCLNICCFFFRMITFSLSLASRLKSYFHCWKTGFCSDIHEKIRSCYIRHCRCYQICADSIREASDTWILNMPKKGNDNTIEKGHLNRSPESMRKPSAVIVTDSLETLALCHDKLDWLHWPDNQAEWPFRYHSIIQSDIALLFAVCCVSSSSITSHQWMTYPASPTLLSPTPKYAQVKGTPPPLL